MRYKVFYDIWFTMYPVLIPLSQMGGVQSIFNDVELILVTMRVCGGIGTGNGHIKCNGCIINVINVYKWL